MELKTFPLKTLVLSSLILCLIVVGIFFVIYSQSKPKEVSPPVTKKPQPKEKPPAPQISIEEALKNTGAPSKPSLEISEDQIEEALKRIGSPSKPNKKFSEKEIQEALKSLGKKEK